MSDWRQNEKARIIRNQTENNEWSKWAPCCKRCGTNEEHYDYGFCKACFFALVKEMFKAGHNKREVVGFLRRSDPYDKKIKKRCMVCGKGQRGIEPWIETINMDDEDEYYHSGECYEKACENAPVTNHNAILEGFSMPDDEV